MLAPLPAARRVLLKTVGGFVCCLALFLLAERGARAEPPVEKPAAPAEDIAFFEKEVRPLLARHCYECHSARAKDVKGGLQLDFRQAVLQGGDRGPLAIAGKPAESLLLAAVEFTDDDLQMPPAGKMQEHEIRMLREWVQRGLPMPDGAPEAATGRIDWKAARAFWSFQPLALQSLPPLRQVDWPETRIDHFLLHQLEAQQLAPSPRADRRELIRRVSLDLTGLPPTPAEVEQFVSDESPTAYVRLVDRLLASPAYGERWGRYWLDLARYTDVTASWLKSTGQAHLYRDWVVKSYNADTPYPDFVKRQLATDLLPETGPDDLPALGFIGLSPEYWKELQLPPDLISGIVAEEWEERIDAVGRTFLGLTLACARCHDHKFDPVTAEDYYALAGVFASVRAADRYMLPDAEAQAVEAAHKQVAALQNQVKALEKKLAAEKAAAAKKAADEKAADEKAADEKAAATQAADAAADIKPVASPVDEAPSLEEQIQQLNDQIAAIERDTPHYAAPLANAIEDASLYVLPNGINHTRLEYKPGEARNLPLQKRGDPTMLGPEVERRFLTLFGREGSPPPFEQGSGRKELAEAIVGDAGPLTARVLVNRVWSHHFGRGLVTTPSNFGLQGELPSHPALLEDLTARFVAQGWSLKWLHRELLLSAAWQQTSRSEPAKAAIDPDNRWLWRMPRRRLEVEAWRDSALFVAGELERRQGGEAVDLSSTTNHRRTVYGIVHRRDLNVMLRLFDFPEPTKHSPQRNETNTPLQQLFVLNSPFMLERAAALNRRLAADAGDDPSARIERAYRLLYARAPRPAERAAAEAFLNAAPNREAAWLDYAQALLASNEFLFVD
ncbi:PSD1 and planctomycete cytochrome C domain-containing protein [Lignipirellula cremea]|uniref:Planctomycete cytochrome C n=1 Tax=Lignipirellula cremea TaxID=2528010 RepID=A0A518DPB4_9BACT|nr:PSD1 and planctomycete cytochrome C domain-containing protein [Lignipirellula cremea]QDU93680.1 Planctomycete cytochrome C [Lignipirellula cremea]